MLIVDTRTTGLFFGRFFAFEGPAWPSDVLVACGPGIGIVSAQLVSYHSEPSVTFPLRFLPRVCIGKFRFRVFVSNSRAEGR